MDLLSLQKSRLRNGWVGSHFGGTDAPAASEAEGFGLPLIEAGFYGLPVLARDISVFREVAGEAASFFDGDSAEGLVDGVLGWVERRAELRVPDPKSMRVMSWRQSAEALLEQLTR